MKWLRCVVLSVFAIGLLGLSCIYLINRRVQSAGAPKLQTSMTEIPVENPPRIAIVFGAEVWDDKMPSPVLYDRVVTAVELYRAGRVKKILMSGDNPIKDYDEPTAMKETAVRLGVAETDVLLDFAGRRTYDTCYRAKEIFGVQKAIIVTQEFHQARALYLCSNLGVDSIGITADRRKYQDDSYWSYREFFARVGAWYEINFVSFESIGGRKELIE